MKENVTGLASINGKISLLEEAQISISDRGFLFGQSIFETCLVKNNEIIFWEDHYSRMKLSCHGAFIQIPNEEILLKWCRELINKHTGGGAKITDKVQLRIIVSGGNSFDFPIKKIENHLPNPNVVIICRDARGPTQEQYQKGLALKTLPDLRAQGLIDIKSCSYLYNLIALENARNQGYDDALFVNGDGLITESTTANFLWFDSSYAIHTAPFAQSCLAGTTLNQLILGLSKKNEKLHWKELHITHINNAIGCAIISSIRGVVPIYKIDDHSFDVSGHSHIFDEMNTILNSQMGR